MITPFDFDDDDDVHDDGVHDDDDDDTHAAPTGPGECVTFCSCHLNLYPHLTLMSLCPSVRSIAPRQLEVLPVS